jgi:endosialidase-like protein
MRMLLSRILCLVSIVWVAAVTGLHAQQTPLTSAVLTPVPRLIWFTDTFHPADNLPVAPLEKISVAVYRDREGGDVVWRETQNVVMNADGRYRILMGSTSSDGIPLDVFTSGEPRWIGITVSRPGEVEQPRVHLASVPYAMKAADSDTLGGKPASAYLLAEPSSAAADAGGQRSKHAGDQASPTTAGTAGYLGRFVDSASLGDSALYQSGAAIGLGTTTPVDAFHVAFTNGTGNTTGYAVQNLSGAAGAYSGMLFYDQNGALGQFQGFNNATHEYRINNVAAAGTINFMIGSSSKFLVANSGNIGIGVPVPGAKLDAAGDINTTTQYNIGSSRVLGVPGAQSIFVGVGAGQVSGGGSNSFVGWNAGSNNTGSNNSFFGRIAGKFNTGSGNAFFGDGIGQSNTGSDNTFVGKDAGFNNAAGTRNSFVGKNAGSGNQTGTDNSSFGFQAGANNIGFCCNVFFGAFSGNNAPAGSNNTLVGYATELGVPGLTNATAIGSQATVAQSNALVLGSIAGENTAPADTNVGIGTTAPLNKLHLRGAGSDPSGHADLRITGTGLIGSAVTLESLGTGGRTYTWLSTADNTGGGGFGPGRLAVYDATASAYRMVIDGTGNVGIGTFTPDHLLSVNGTADKVGGGSWDVFSDERLKNITGRFTRGVDALMQLQPIRFEYKPDNALGLTSSGEHVGFSAQAVQKVVPEAVSTNDRGYLLVNNDPILWTMLNAIQEQQAAIRALQQQNTDLQQRLASLEAIRAGRR